MIHALAVVVRNTKNAVADSLIDPVSMIRPRRKIRGISAILLPFQENGDPDWPGFSAHVQRTVLAGLAPAVNMDTGFGNLIDDSIRRRALELTQAETDDFVAAHLSVINRERHSMIANIFAKWRWFKAMVGRR